MPSIEISVASVVFQASTALPPGLMLSGVTVIEAVGEGEVAAGGGGGGGGTAFLWHPAAKVRVATAMSEAKCLCCGIFTIFSCLVRFPGRDCCIGPQAGLCESRYFQLQLGIEFPLLWVSRCCSVPSESMVHISAPPPF